MTLSNYIENKILDHIFTSSTTPFVTTTTVYASLHTGDPGETGTGSPLASCPRFRVHMGAAVSATSVNDATASVVTSASAAAITHIGLWDGTATDTANHLWNGPMTSGGVRIIAAGSTVTLAIGILQVSLD